MTCKKLNRFLSLLLSLSCLASAHEFPIAGAGVVERELQAEYDRQRFDIQGNVPAIQIDIPEDVLNFPEGKKVLISTVEFKGNDCLSCDFLNDWITEHLNQEMSIKDIYALCICIDQCYAQQGFFLARAYPPPQDIKDNHLVIEVIEGKLGKVEVMGNCFYDSCFISSYFDHLIGCPLHYGEFLRALLLLNENQDLLASAIFKKGEEFGSADVILNIEDCRPVHLYLNGNNYGKDLTTNTRIGGRLDWGNFLFQGDMLSFAQVVGLPIDDLYFTDIEYTVPLNRQGTFLQLEYLTSRFDIDRHKQLHLSGRSDIATVGLEHAVYRTRCWSADVFGTFDYKQIKNYIFNHQTSADKLRVLTLGFQFDRYIPCCSREYLNIRLGVGLPSFLGGSKAVDKECSRHNAGGRFTVFNIDYDRLQILPADWYFYFHASGQWSPYRLTLPEQIYLGGDETVRGYPLAYLLGDSGYYTNCELRFPPPFFGNKNFFMLDKTWKDIIQFDIFLDTGAAAHKSDNAKFLCGTGLGVRIYGPYTLTLSIDVGFPLTEKKHVGNAIMYMKLTAQPF